MERINDVARLFEQLIDGWDIPTAGGVLRIKQEDAMETLPNAPYSLLKNLAHAVYWQDLWLGRLAGKPSTPQMEVWKGDWREPDPKEWKDLRTRFVVGLAEASRIADTSPLEHRMASDAEARDRLIMIAIHGAYHLGQLNLLKAMSRRRKRSAVSLP